eukprot:235159-Rhodomonas_salina.1
MQEAQSRATQSPSGTATIGTAKQWKTHIAHVQAGLSTINDTLTKETAVHDKKKLKAALKAVQDQFRRKRCTFRAALLRNPP